VLITYEREKTKVKERKTFDLIIIVKV